MDVVADEGAVDTEEPKKEEKFTSVMEAANALTALGDEDEVAPDASNTLAKLDNDDDVDHPVDKPTEENTDSKEVAESAVTIKLEEITAAATAVPVAMNQPPLPLPPPDESGGTVTSVNSGGTGTAASSTNGGSSKKRFLPDHKKPDAALTFPEKMMALMRSVDEHKDDPFYCAAWLPEGKSFVVRNPDEFARQVVPKFFKATKFSSFTRKLYRWGFRQINRGIGPDDPVIFGNDFFERDNEALMTQMRSITAAGTRKTESRMIGAGNHHHNMYGKRPFEGIGHEYGFDAFAEQQKRFMYEQFLHQQKSAQMMQPQHNLAMQGGMGVNGPMYMNHPMNSGNGGQMMDSGYPQPHHMMPPMGNKQFDMMKPMHPDGPSQPMMMNMGYNPMHTQQIPQQQSYNHSAPQQMAPLHGGGMMPPVPGMGENPAPQHMGQSMVGPANGPNGMMQTLPLQQQQQQQQQQQEQQQGGSVGASSGDNGNQNTTEIVNAAIRALHYSA